jgi:hypothetical protein
MVHAINRQFTVFINLLLSTSIQIWGLKVPPKCLPVVQEVICTDRLCPVASYGINCAENCVPIA